VIKYRRVPMYFANPINIVQPKLPLIKWID
jgi:hypothetical protein